MLILSPVINDNCKTKRARCIRSVISKKERTADKIMQKLMQSLKASLHLSGFKKSLSVTTVPQKFFPLAVPNSVLFMRGVEWSLKNYGSRQILHESRNLGVTNKSLGISSSQGRTRNFTFCNLSFGSQAKESS